MKQRTTMILAATPALAGAAAFTRKDLKKALASWLENSGAAEALYVPIGVWDLSKVTDMEGTFTGAAVFNADIGGWDVSSVTDITWAFAS